MSLLDTTDLVLINNSPRTREIRTDQFFKADKLALEYQAMCRYLESLRYCIDIDTRLGIEHSRDATEFCHSESPALGERLKGLIESPMGHQIDRTLSEDRFMLTNLKNAPSNCSYRLYITDKHYMDF